MKQIAHVFISAFVGLIVLSITSGISFYYVTKFPDALKDFDILELTKILAPPTIALIAALLGFFFSTRFRVPTILQRHEQATLVGAHFDGEISVSQPRR